MRGCLIGLVVVAGAACTGAPDAGRDEPGALERHVRYLCGIEPPRAAAHPASLSRAADYIAGAFRAAGADVHLQEFDVGGERYRNVRATLGPESRECVVVGAHYDVAGPGPGADDNASGVAALLEVARRLGRVRLERRVELVAFALEEPPHFGTDDMGSVRHAHWLASRGQELRGMICLEMVGYFRDEPGSQRFPHESLRAWYPDRGDFIAVVGRARDRDLVEEVHERMAGATPLPVHGLAAPIPIEGIDLSDHRSYWAAGYTAVMVTDTAFFRNPHYHEETDTPDTLDYRRMAQVVAGVTEAVVALANE